jgi:hypothetical protein
VAGHVHSACSMALADRNPTRAVLVFGARLD